METEITIQRALFVSLIGQLIGSNPNPDDASPPGPGGPVIHLGGLDWVALNPQPLPPRQLRAVALAQEVIQSIHALAPLPEILSDESQGRLQDALARRLSNFVDDCGTRWPGWWLGKIKFPPPPPPPPPRPEELIILGAHFAGVAEQTGNEPLQKLFNEVGDRLMSLGLERLQG